jgi:hypothetical protein
MMNFFKRTVATVVTPHERNTLSNTEERRRFSRQLPMPEVVDGNGGDTEWALWTEATDEQNKN